ncbi:Uncharacterized membrane protein YczE [Sinosporangium album]|uniref:Uncharacterized membrane protein YczE n=1 Tax=Sinosporangium album TaxID=504805 RepID=A0A1G8G0Y9_9ACTN|nr:hypothetical protein [Sinosporangium album]SDH88025.1 Uncharacterized membrane protein YczE [Sinosporangium album]
MSETTLRRLGPLPGRLVRLYAGLALYGAGIGLQIESTLGNFPWDVFHHGLSLMSGWSIGLAVTVVGVFVMLLWIPLRQKPGLGTISNVFCIGLFADLTLWLAPTPGDLAVRWAFLAAAIVITAVATGLYIGAGFGAGPRDGLMTGLAAKGLSIRLSRMLIEVTVLLAGWLLGGNLGIGTLVFALSIGPMTQFFMPLLAADRRSGAPGV